MPKRGAPDKPRNREGGGKPKNIDPVDYGEGGDFGAGQGQGQGNGFWKQARKFMNSPMGWLWMQQMMNQGGGESEGNEGTIYEDDVTYEMPGAGQYAGDYQVDPATGQLVPTGPATPQAPTAPQTPSQPSYGAAASQMGEDPWEGFFPPQAAQGVLPQQSLVASGGIPDLVGANAGMFQQAAASPVAKPTGGKLGIPQAYQTFRQAGFGDEQARLMTAIAMGESGLNPMAHNPNAATGDNSYGLTQVNMLGGLGPARMKEYGLQSNEDLFDPLTNAKAAFGISGGGKNFSPWSVYKKGAHQQYMDDVQKALASQMGPAPIGTAPTTTEGTAPEQPTKLPGTELEEDEDEEEDED